MRPAPLLEVLPQVGLQRHTVEQKIEHSPYLQILDAPVPQKVEQLEDFFKDLDIEVPAQVIEVPKISQDIIPQRSVDLVPQMVEQLVEVPTIISYSSLQRTVEHRVDIPVPGRGGRSSGLQGFLPGQSSTTPQFSKKRISERTVEQFVRFPGEGLQDFRPRQSSPASSSFHSPAHSDDDANEPGEGVFRTFPMEKSAECRAGRCGPAPARQLMDPGGL